MAVFEDANRDFGALISSQGVEVLVTRIRFQPGQPRGVALAAAARMTRPMLKVTFVALPEVACHAKDEGRVFAMPVHPDNIAQGCRGGADYAPSSRPNAHLTLLR